MTANIVKLYIYDLSNGLARQLSRQLTGKQIDGIWFVIKCLIVAFFLILYGSPGIPRSWCSGEVCYSQFLDIMCPSIFDRDILRTGNSYHFPWNVSCAFICPCNPRPVLISLLARYAFENN